MKTKAIGLAALMLPAVSAVCAESTLYFGGSGGAVEIEKLNWPADCNAFTVECRFKPIGKLAGAVALVSRWSDDLKSEDKGSFTLVLCQR